MKKAAVSSRGKGTRAIARLLVAFVGMSILSAIGAVAAPDVAGAAPEDCGLSSPYSETNDADGDGIDDATEIANSQYAVDTWGIAADSSDPCDASSFYFESCPTGTNDPVPASYNAQFNHADTFGIVAPGVEYTDLDELIFIANPSVAPAGTTDPISGSGPDVCDASYNACGVDILTDTPGDWDSDGDGTSNADEVAAGTDPCVIEVLICGSAVDGYDPATTDSDSDGVMDADETTAGTDMCSADETPVLVCGAWMAEAPVDADSDGLSDADEILYGSDPCDANDTATGTMVCGQEIFGYDASVNDADMDGVTDADETAAGTDPCVAEPDSVMVCGVEVTGYDAATTDSDSDGVMDAAETAAGSDPCVPETMVCNVLVANYDANTHDADGDTITDAAEAASGSDICVKDQLPFTGFNTNILFFAATALIVGFALNRMGDTQIRFN